MDTVIKDFLKFTVRVVIEKEIEVELPANFASDEYLSDFRSALWEVEGVGEVAEYAARMAAEVGGGYEHDGLGLLSPAYSKWPREPDVKFTILHEDIETHIIKGNE